MKRQETMDVEKAIEQLEVSLDLLRKKGDQASSQALELAISALKKQKWVFCIYALPRVINKYSDCEYFIKKTDGTIEPVGIFTIYESDTVLVTDGGDVYTAIYYRYVRENLEVEQGWKDNIADSCNLLENIVAWMPCPKRIAAADLLNEVADNIHVDVSTNRIRLKEDSNSELL